MAIDADSPITTESSDLFARAPMAKDFVEHVLRLDNSAGVTVGIYGRWGTGKTSFVNLVKRELQRRDVASIDFNPWLFSGAEELVQRFMAEMFAELGVRDYGTLAAAFEEYGRALAGARSGAWLRLAGTILRRGRGGTERRRQAVADCLAQCVSPIVVVLDDIDRLESGEMLEVLRLVRLTASFPRLVYLVVCDRLAVEKAIGAAAWRGACRWWCGGMG